MSIVSGTVGAVMGSNATESAAETGAQAQRDATAAQERIYSQMRADFEPYRQIGLSSLPYLQSAVLGGPVAINENASGYTQLSPAEVQQLNAQYSSTPTPATTQNRSHLTWPNTVPTTTANTTPAAPRYSTSLNWYRAPDGTITNTIPGQTRTVEFNPGTSPAAQYQLEKGNTALQRSLAARGLAGSGYSASKTGDLAKSVAAADWQDQYNRLLDLTKIGTGASSATGSAANSLSNAYGQGANNLANSAMQAGNAKASLYSGLGAASANTVGTGLRAYNYMNDAGWFGSGAAASGVGSAAANYGAIDNAAAAYGEYAAAV